MPHAKDNSQAAAENIPLTVTPQKENLHDSEQNPQHNQTQSTKRNLKEAQPNLRTQQILDEISSIEATLGFVDKDNFDYIKNISLQNEHNDTVSLFEGDFVWTKGHYVNPHERHYPAVRRFLEELEHITHCNLHPEKITFLRIVSNNDGLLNQPSLQIYLTGGSGYGKATFGGKYDSSGIGLAVEHAKNRAIERANIVDIEGLAKMDSQVEKIQDQPLADDKHYRKIFNPDDINLILNNTDGKSRSDERLTSLGKKIQKTSPYKPMALITDEEHAHKILASLHQQFPNFEPFIKNLQNHVSLSVLGDGTLQMDPVLFVGPPGIGKSSILKYLAQIFSPQPPLFQINFGSSQSGSILSGSDIFWDNTREGELFNLLVHGKCANPIVFLDEVDKTSTDAKYSPIGPLYYLLERSTAKIFKDLSVPNFEVDASHIQWFAAANDVQLIDSAILSRFEVFEIPVPDAEQMNTIARNIYQTLLKNNSWGHNFDTDVSDECLKKIQHGSPRDARREILAACARASGQKRFVLCADDFQETHRTHKIGF